jgi:uncharacterized protein (TIGR03086 family)
MHRECTWPHPESCGRCLRVNGDRNAGVERGRVAEQGNTVAPTSPDPLLRGLARAFDAVGALVANVRPDQWSAPTPCTDWTVRRLVEHLIGMNRVLAALLADAPLPRRPAADAAEEDGAELVPAYRETAASLQRAFARPGALARQYSGPLGSATGAERLQIRLYDLLAHGWDLAQATGQPADLPDDLAEQSLAFVRTQLTEQARPGRFAPAQDVSAAAPALDRLVAFLGRPISAGRH